MTGEAPIDLAALVNADSIIVERSHSGKVVDTSEPLAGEPAEYNEDRGELRVDLDDRVAQAYLSVYDHDGETVTATLGRRVSRPRDRGTTYTVDSVEAEWGL